MDEQEKGSTALVCQVFLAFVFSPIYNIIMWKYVSTIKEKDIVRHIPGKLTYKVLSVDKFYDEEYDEKYKAYSPELNTCLYTCECVEYPGNVHVFNADEIELIF